MHLDTIIALEALRNALYKFKTYLLTYLLTKQYFLDVFQIQHSFENCTWNIFC